MHHFLLRKMVHNEQHIDSIVAFSSRAKTGLIKYTHDAAIGIIFFFCGKCRGLAVEASCLSFRGSVRVVSVWHITQ